MDHLEKQSGMKLIWQAPGFGERILLMEMRRGKLLVGTTAGVYEMSDSGEIEKVGDTSHGNNRANVY